MKRIWKSLLTLAWMAWIASVTPATADTITITAVADGEVFLSGGTPTLGSQTQAFNTSQNVVPGQEWRSVYEFDLPLLTDPIVSATFLGAVTSNANIPPTNTLSFFGRSGNGTLEAADALAVATLLGSTTVQGGVPAGTALPISVSLDPLFIQALGSGFLGLTTTVGTGGTVLVASLENPNPSFQRPTLQLVTEPIVTPPTDGIPPPAAIPEPATLVLLGSGLAAVTARARRRQQRDRR